MIGDNNAKPLPKRADKKIRKSFTFLFVSKIAAYERNTSKQKLSSTTASTTISILVFYFARTKENLKLNSKMNENIKKNANEIVRVFDKGIICFSVFS